MFLARVFISLKPTVNDPQGLTIQGSLHQLGFDSVTMVRAGKYIQLSVAEAEESVAAKQVEEMCEKLLANPIIEQFRYELERIDDP